MTKLYKVIATNLTKESLPDVSNFIISVSNLFVVNEYS